MPARLVFIAALFLGFVAIAEQSASSTQPARPTEAQLKAAAMKLIASAQAEPDAEGVQAMLAFSRDLSAPPEIRSRTLAVYALTLLMQGNTNAFTRVTQILGTTFPDQAPLITVTPKDYIVTCEACGGKGRRETACSACRGAGACKTCNGTRRTEGVCATCQSKGQLFMLGAAVRENYLSLLSGIVTVCQENADYPELLKKAENEKNIDARIRLLQSLTNSFAHRADVAQAQSLLGAALATRADSPGATPEQDAEAQSGRDVAELRKLASTENPEKAGKALRSYLAEHPQSPARQELQSLLDGIAAERTKKGLVRKPLIGLATLVCVLPLMLIARRFLQRNSGRGLKPLPGMGRIDKTKFTDPLTLTAQDSRARAEGTPSDTLSPVTGVPKLRLKEQPAEPVAAKDWLQNRYAQPRPPTVLERLGAAVKRFGLVLALVVVSASVFLAIPFRRWDDYAAWQKIQDAVAALEAQPDSLPVLRDVLAAAEAANILWSQPSGARPEKWYQGAQLERYDASYGLIQLLSLGSIKHGNAPRGISELDRLHQRTGRDSIPGFPGTGEITKTCKQCQNGKTSKKCATCGGGRKCPRCDGRGTLTVSTSTSAFPLTAKLVNSRTPNKPSGGKSVVQHKCPDCLGEGKCKTCAGEGQRTQVCPACGGKVTLIDLAAVALNFQNTIRSVRTAVAKSMVRRHAIHIAANVQRALWLKGGEAGRNVLSAVHGDSIFGNTDSPAASLQSAQTNGNAAAVGGAGQDILTAADKTEADDSTKKKPPEFFLQWTQNEQLFGPYPFVNDAQVGPDKNPYILHIVEPDSFTLESKKENKTYGPFKFQQNAVVTLASSTFLLVLERNPQ